MKPLEMLVMIKAGLGEEGLAACRERLTGWLEDNDGRLEEVYDLGEIQLAHAVKKNRRGHFLLFWFEGPAALPAAIAQRIRIDEEILRHLLIHRHPASLKTFKRSSEDKGNGKRGK
ncbi:MAG: 30S ribosomal protein S6 [Candidatus Coatesbacteria bacterium]|nr:MAG: 30S ribosomal protein S6 [Candidatus Coatesbacteria bacterium]